MGPHGGPWEPEIKVGLYVVCNRKFANGFDANYAFPRWSVGTREMHNRRAKGRFLGCLLFGAAAWKTAL